MGMGMRRLIPDPCPNDRELHAINDDVDIYI